MMSPVEEFRRLDHTWIEIAGSRLPPVCVTYLADEGEWRLEHDYVYQDGDTAILVPGGFRFDLSSVPRILWFMLSSFELGIAAPLLHDFLYRNGGKALNGSIEPPRTYSRAEVDRMFRAIMEAEGVAVWRRLPAYLAVRALGGSAWRG